LGAFEALQRLPEEALPGRLDRLRGLCANHLFFVSREGREEREGVGPSELRYVSSRTSAALGYKRGMIARLFALLLMVCGSGCRSVDAPDVAPYGPREYAGLTRGTYVAVGEACSAPSAAFRYDGTGVGWIRRGSAQAELRPIFRVREGPTEYVTNLPADRPGMNGPDASKEADLSILSLGDGERIAVTAAKRIVVRICPEAALPVWARERPVFMQLRPGMAPVALDGPSGGGKQ
jgi:hypothetical protein